MTNILITKSEDEIRKYKRNGINIIPFPTIKTVPLDFDIDTDRFDIYIFTSVNAVKHFFNKISPERIKNKKIMAVGKKTKSALEKLNFKKIEIPNIQSSEGLLKTLSKYNYINKRICLPRAKKGIDLLEKEFKNLTVIPIYETVLNIPKNKKEVKELFEKNLINFVLFTSPSNIENFIKIFKKRSVYYLKRTDVIPIGKTTGKKLKELGIEPLFIPEEPSIEKIISQIAST